MCFFFVSFISGLAEILCISYVSKALINKHFPGASCTKGSRDTPARALTLSTQTPAAKHRRGVNINVPSMFMTSFTVQGSPLSGDGDFFLLLQQDCKDNGK